GEHGYTSIISGKWHLGMEESQSPRARGFEKSFSLIPGGASHFADMRPAYAPRPDIKAFYREDGRKLDKLPDTFEYSSQYYVDYMLDALREREDADQPFFAYLSFTAPHWPLQAPDAAINKFKGSYDDGYDALRSQRLAGGIRAGVLPAGSKESPAPAAYKPWSDLNDVERQRQAREMEVYAAMISELDRHTGRLIEHLRETGELDNTVIVFMADNGAEGHDLNETWPADLFPDIRKTIDESHDFSFDQIGRPGSYSLYGHGWGWAGSPAFNLYKAFPTEGGTRAAAFVSYTQWQNAPDIYSGLISVKDVMPTFLELASIDHQTKEGYEPVTGQSQLTVLADREAVSNADERVLATELFGKRAVRKGDWKIVHMPQPYGGDRWRLYNLKDDLAESIDLSEQYPEKFNEMLALWDTYQQENSVILPDWVSGY
ncbi:MAG: sulfatase-like hydrolase/transferase, partial [Pseudomonadota bacterium]